MGEKTGVELRYCLMIHRTPTFQCIGFLKRCPALPKHLARGGVALLFSRDLACRFKYNLNNQTSSIKGQTMCEVSRVFDICPVAHGPCARSSQT